MKKDRLLWAAIVGLLVLNLVTLGYVLRTRTAPPGGGGPWRYVSSTLSLTPAQQELYTQLRHQHRAEMDRLTDAYRRLLQPYLTLLGSPVPDAAQKAGLESQLAGIERLKVQITFAHFQELKAICTPAQQQRFPEMAPRLADVLCGPARPPREADRRP